MRRVLLAAVLAGCLAAPAQAQESFGRGEYRWVAEVVNHVVFADPGYQAESGPWRNFYLTGAQELRKGVAQLPTPSTASPDIVSSMTPEMFFDFLAVRLDAEKAGDVELDGDQSKVEALVASLDSFEFWFNIVEP